MKPDFTVSTIIEILSILPSDVPASEIELNEEDKEIIFTWRKDSFNYVCLFVGGLCGDGTIFAAKNNEMYKKPNGLSSLPSALKDLYFDH